MTQRNSDRRLDFEALRYAIERRDPDLMLGFYAEDAQLSIVNIHTPHASPFELRGKGEIAKHLRAAFGQEASHRVERDAAVGEDRVTFWEACEYPDGGRVWVETTLEVKGGKILRQVDVVTRDPPADREEEIGQRSPNRKTQPDLPQEMQRFLPPTNFYASNEQPKRRISDDVQAI
jgi:hypothetical protein